MLISYHTVTCLVHMVHYVHFVLSDCHAFPQVLDLVTAVFNGGGDEALDVPVLRPTVTE